VRPDTFVETLARTRFGEAFNFYACGEGAARRRERLAAYLEARAKAPVLLVGEAPGYRGARISGIPFTSERQLSGTGPAEATATIVHRVLERLGLGADVLLWNAVPAHPHRPGEPRSNRRPTRAELEAGRPFVEALAEGRAVIPVGRVSGEAVGLPWIRHPSRGGASAFAAGLLERTRLLHSASGGRVVRRFSVES
jgi:uracil-DNA glycosylase